MRYALLALASASAAAYAQSPELAERLRRAVVTVEAVDRALVQAQELQRERVHVARLQGLRIHQPYVLRVSGVAVSAKGEIVTAALHPRADLRVTVGFFDGRQKEARLVGTDPLSNLALLQVDGGTEDFLPLEDLAPRQSETVFLGGAGAAAMDGRVGLQELTVQIEDCYGACGCRPIPVASAFAVVTRPAPLCPGSACVDGEGRLLGVLMGSMPPQLVPDPKRPGQTTLVQIQFGTPAARVARIVHDLRSRGRVVRAWFGLEFSPVAPELRAHFDVPASACAVTAVEPDSPAAAAGFRVHDVLVSLDGRNYRDAFAFHEALADRAQGKPAEFRVLRAGKELTLSATPLDRR